MEPKAFDELKAALRGPLLLPGDAGYDDARSVWNGMIDRRPAGIVRCLGSADVVAGVAFAKRHGLALSIKGGGHNIAGLAVADGALTLDMSLMRGVHVDASRRTAVAQAGCLLGDVDRETQLQGLAAVLGFVSNTGIAGLTLGGGFGYLTPRYGWTSDTLLAIDGVTADGRVVRASEDENADLFWGLRGGGGNFAVATHFTYRLQPVGPQVMGGAVAWRAEAAAEVLEMHRRVMADAPPELVSVPVLRPAPPAPWLPADVHGKPVIVMFVCDTGPLEEAAKRVAPIKAFGAPIGDILQPRPYVSQQSLIDAAQPKGRRYYWKSEYLPGLDPALAPKLIEHAALIGSPHSAIVLFPIGGAVSRVPAGYSAAGNRDAAFVLNITAAWDSPAEDARHIEWARKTWAAVKPFSTGGTYVNFLTAEEGEDRIRAAYGGNYDRLAELKARWDPDNLFRANKNIAPKS